MDLYILRHAIAVDRKEHRGKDADRPLTPRGRRKMQRIVKGMHRLGLRFDVIISSPLPRARQTAEIVARGLSRRGAIANSPCLAPGKNPVPLLASLANSKHESVLLVGHEPQLSGLISTLMSGSGELAVKMKKGGVCKLSISRHCRPGSATLEWLITPSQLSALR